MDTSLIKISLPDLAHPKVGPKDYCMRDSKKVTAQERGFVDSILKKGFESAIYL